MGEKKGVKAFLKKTFELKKKPEDEEPKDAAVKKTAATKPAVPSSKTTQKTSPNTASKPAATSASKSTSKPVSKTPAKTPSEKKAGTKPAAAPKTASKTAATKSAATTKSAAPSKDAATAPPKKPVEFSKNMTKADNVRFYIYQNYFKPAKLKGQNKITLNAGDVHKEMGLKSEIPTVASSMKTRIDRLYDVEILDIRPPGAANSKVTVKYDLRNLYMEEENVKPVIAATEKLKSGRGGKIAQAVAMDAESNYLILKELEEKLRQFVSDRCAARFGKEWWKGTDMSFLADRWKERRIMNERTNADKRSARNDLLINYASFSDYRRIINNPFAWDAFEEYFPDRGWIIQRLKELDPIRNAIMHHTPLEEDDYIRLGLYSRDILKIIDKSAEGKEKQKVKQTKKQTEKQNEKQK